MTDPGAPSGRDISALSLGIVVIGRNEGERLRTCLGSVGGSRPVVYVDSGSTDDSIAIANASGAVVCALDMTLPFTAARARNAGFERLLQARPEVEVVQFVDGDCEVVAGWLERALAFLAERPDVVAVCGRRRERHPERSVYNRLCDIEWNTPVGQAKACGGDVAIRAAAFRAVGGFRDDLIAGEEPELCIRLRAAGGLIWRLDAEMTLHDAAMLRFSQWWKRSMRSGYAFAQGAALHGGPPERHWVRESRSAWVWGVAVPLAVLAAAAVVDRWAILAFGIYPVQIARLHAGEFGPTRTRWAWAGFLVVGKFAEAAGQIRFMIGRLSGRAARLIEYK